MIRFISIVVLIAAVAPGFAATNATWNHRENAEDRFHSNEAYIRPWRSGSPTAPWPTASEDPVGRYVGNYGYEIGWSSGGEVSWSFGPDGSFSVSAGSDHQWHAWTYVYVMTARTVSISGGGDCVPRFFVDGQFDAPRTVPTSVALTPGWHRFDYTGYNQNNNYSCGFGALNVEVVSNVARPTCSSFVAPDFDEDCDVDDLDIQAFTNCSLGPEMTIAEACQPKDFDNDDDADLNDFGVVQRCYNGANNPVDPNCAVICSLNFEAEDGISPPVIMPRSDASGERTVWLHAEESLRIDFTVENAGLYLFRTRTSNDNNNYAPLETVTVTLDSVTLGSFQPPDTGDGGFGWNVFTTSSIGSASLTAGTHTIVLSVSGGDTYGVELDLLTLDRLAE